MDNDRRNQEAPLVLAFEGYAAITALLIHGGTAIYMIVIGGILLLKPAIDPPTQDPR
jgi:hypothetical protein